MQTTRSRFGSAQNPCTHTEALVCLSNGLSVGFVFCQSQHLGIVSSHFHTDQLSLRGILCDRFRIDLYHRRVLRQCRLHTVKHSRAFDVDFGRSLNAEATLHELGPLPFLRAAMTFRRRIFRQLLSIFLRIS